MRQLKSLIQRHLKFTGSQVARQILLNWDKERTKFVKVPPGLCVCVREREALLFGLFVHRQLVLAD